MPLRRVYLPLSPTLVTALPVTREIGPAPIMAYAVTPSMIRRGGALDDEELELQAWVAAAQAAERICGRQARRVIAAADVDDLMVEYPDPSTDSPWTVSLDAPVTLRRIVSFHVDEEPGGTGVADLLWYDVTELAEVVALLR